MPNYRYHTQDHSRRNTCGCQVPPPTPAPCHPQPTPCQPVPCQPQPTPCCEPVEPCDALSALPLAMAYVPWQKWCHLFDAEKGFCCGTIFEELNKPFKGIGGCCR